MNEEIAARRDRMRESICRKIYEFRSNPELMQEKIAESKRKSTDRYKKLVERAENVPIIDNTTPECPRCGNPKCGKAGFLTNTTGKHQRRKCMVCNFVYTSDYWNMEE